MPLQISPRTPRLRHNKFILPACASDTVTILLTIGITQGAFMLKKRKPALKRRRLLNVASGRRRIKRNVSIMKLHQRRRNYQTYFQHLSETTPAA